MGKKGGKKERDEIDEIEALRKGIILSRSKGDFKELASLHNQLGYIYRIREEFDDAIEQHKDEAKVTREHFPNDKIALAVAYRNIGEVYIDMKDEDTAVLYIKKYLKLAISQKDLVEEQRAHITLGRISLGLIDKYTENQHNDPEAAHKCTQELANAERQFTRAHEILDETRLRNQLKDKELAEMRCGTYLNLGITFDLGDKSDDAIQWIEKAILVARTCGFGDSLHRSYSSLYTIYMRLEKYKESYNTAKLIHKAAKLLGNKLQEFEAHILEAKALFLLNEVDKGMNVLKKIRKQIKRNESAKDLLEEIDPLLTSAVRIYRAEDDGYATERHDLQKLKNIFEVKGDNYVTLGNLQEAIKNYLQSISYAEKLGLTGKPLSALYYSLAVTYKDCGQYENALRYFRKEMKINEGNRIEEFRTQTNIADCLERGKKPIDMVVNAYQEAIKFSRDFPSKEIIARKALAQYYKSIGNNDKFEKLSKHAQQLEKTLKLSSHSEEENSEEFLLDEDDPIDLDELSSGDSDTEEEDLPKNTIVAHRPVKFRKNEKGETPLHIAAQKGDIKSVRRLLAQGHEVNPRDYSGWIPLHEACNFGHLDVVEELLKHRANVDDSGGSVCNGVTPLHDAASNGHIAVMRALLRHKASAVARDAESNRPVESLVSWFERERKTGALSEDQIDEYNEMKEYLINEMKKVGKTYTKHDEEKAKRKARRRTPSPVFSLMTTNNMDDPVPVIIKVDNENEGRAAVNEYNETMSRFRRTESTATFRAPRNEMKPSTSKDALLEESQYIAGDWMVPDENLAPDVSTSKRKRDPFEDLKLADRSTRRKREGKRNAVAQMDIIRDSRLAVESLCSGESDHEVQPVDSQTSNSDQNSESEVNNVESTFTFSNLSETVRDTDMTIEDSDDDDFRGSKSSLMDTTDDSPPKVVRLRQNKLPFARVSTGTLKKSSSSNSLRERSVTPTLGNAKPSFKLNLNQLSRSQEIRPQEPTLRLKIEILDTKILVPVLQLDETIEWLCQEAADRYYKQSGNGMKPMLTLSTKDGAILSRTDTIRDAISEFDNELKATIEDCAMVASSTVFLTACKKLNVEANDDVVLALTRSETTEGLLLTDTCLRGKINEALFQTLQHNLCLRELNLSGCSLRDEGFKRLCSIIHTLAGLEKLDVSCNGLTHEGLGRLTEACTKVNSPGQTTRHPIGIKLLILDHNPLGNSITCSLFQIIPKLQNLQQISVVDCNLTAAFFSKNKRDLITVINASSIEILNVSYNHMGKGTVQILRTEMNSNSRLEIIATCCE